jgi:HEAT repeat protein
MRWLVCVVCVVCAACDRPDAAPAPAPVVSVVAAPDMAVDVAPDGVAESAEDAADAGSGMSPGTTDQIAMLTRAKRYVLEQDLDSAEPLFEELVKEERFSAVVLTAVMALAELRIEQKHPEQALALYQAMLEREDARGYGESWLMVGRMYGALGETARGIEALKEAVRLEPGWFFVLAELALQCEVLGDKQGVEEYWARYETEQARAVGRLSKKIAGPSERVKIVDAMALVDDERLVAPLIEALKDEEPLVRERAALALGELGETSGAAGREALKAALVHDTQEPVREAARAALKKIPR